MKLYLKRKRTMEYSGYYATNEYVLPLASQSHCWCVHYGHQLLRVLGEQLVEQPLVPLNQVHQVDVPEEVNNEVLLLVRYEFSSK